MTDFESFTRERIARLRAEADALEKTLKEFLGAKARASGGSRRGAEGSAFGAILTAIEAAGAKGLTLDEMIEAAEAEGFEVKRNTLRSQLWQAKQDEKVVQLEAGRYAAVQPTLDAAEAVRGLETLTPARATSDDDGGGGFRRALRPRVAQQEAAPTAPKESFVADLDDEIPF